MSLYDEYIEPNEFYCDDSLGHEQRITPQSRREGSRQYMRILCSKPFRSSTSVYSSYGLPVLNYNEANIFVRPCSCGRREKKLTAWLELATEHGDVEAVEYLTEQLKGIK